MTGEANHVWLQALGITPSRLTHDSLTGLPDDSVLDEILGAVTTYTLNNHKPAALLVVGIDDWQRLVKQADESRLLHQVGNRLQMAVGDQGFVCWLTGETFGVVIADATTQRLAEITRTLLTIFRRAEPLAPLRWPVMVSMGGIEIPRVATHPAMIRRGALMALAEAQAQGGNRAEFCTAERLGATGAALGFNDHIIAAIQTGHVQRAYQPIIAAHNGVVVGYEVLARIMDEQGLPIPAAQFMPLIEQQGLTLELDSQMLRGALYDLGLEPDLCLAINVSGQTVSSPEWMTLIQELLTEQPSIARRLTVEITETSAITNLATAQEFVLTCKKRGVAISFDDFCTGHSALVHLRQLPTQQIKLDQSMIAGLLDQPETQGTVRALIKLAREMGLQTTAEGVEHPAIADWLRAEHIDRLQGFLYARPEMERPWETA